MKTKICKECGNEINIKAEICPKCGCRVKSNIPKIIMICLIIIAILVIGFYSYNKINNSIKEKQWIKEQNEKQAEKDKILGKWVLVDNSESDELNIDKELIITKENVVEGLFGTSCFDEKGNRKSDCVFVQRGSYGDEKLLRIFFNGKIGDYVLCFNLENDYLIEKECPKISNGEYEHNLNIKYKKSNN